MNLLNNTIFKVTLPQDYEKFVKDEIAEIESKQNV
jgi:hypothetical protein